MNDTGKSRTMSYEEILADPSLVDIHEMVRYVHNKPASQVFPRKHEAALTSIVKINTRKLYIEKPHMSIKKVIITIFEPLTDDIPAPLMLKLTQTIIDMWAKISLPVQQDKAVAIAA
jgi:hypothetical protein